MCVTVGISALENGQITLEIRTYEFIALVLSSRSSFRFSLELRSRWISEPTTMIWGDDIYLIIVRIAYHERLLGDAAIKVEFESTNK